MGTRLKADRTLTIALKGAAAPVKLHSVIGLRGLDHLELPQTELLAVYDIAPERTEALSREYGVGSCASIEAAQRSRNGPGL